MTVPAELPAGHYELEIALLDPRTKQPKVRLAIAGRGEEGWYNLGKIEVGKNKHSNATKN